MYIWSHVQHMQILLFGTHNPNSSCGRTHCFSSELFSFSPSFWYCLLICILNTKWCGCLHSLSFAYVNLTSSAYGEPFQLLSVCTSGLDIICCCSFPFGTLSMPMLTSGSSSLDSSPIVSIFLFFSFVLINLFLLGIWITESFRCQVLCLPVWHKEIILWPIIL